MLSQRETRFHKKKIIGGSLLKNVYDKVRNVISTGSKILNRIPTGVKTEIKKLAAPFLKKALEPTKKTLEPVLENIPINKRIINDRELENLNDRSRAILSNLIAGSGFKNYMS